MHPGFSLVGARTDLGLDVEWRFSFVAPGSTVTRGTDLVYLDVGGRLEPGVIESLLDLLIFIGLAFLALLGLEFSSYRYRKRAILMRMQQARGSGTTR